MDGLRLGAGKFTGAQIIAARNAPKEQHRSLVVRAMGRQQQLRKQRKTGQPGKAPDQEAAAAPVEPLEREGQPPQQGLFEPPRFPEGLVQAPDKPDPLSKAAKAVGSWLDQPVYDAGPDSAQENALQQKEEAAQATVLVDLTSPGTAADELPTVSRGQIYSACISTAISLVVVAGLLRLIAARLGNRFTGTPQELVDALLAFPSTVPLQHVGILLGSAGLVTAARLLLIRTAPPFAKATNRTNAQVLNPLSPWDLVLIASIPAFSEELLFRGGLIPALYPDWRGVTAAGIAFGVVHVGGGRNAAFAVWASLVGILYGAAYVATQDIWVPVGAHALANFAAALIWKLNQPQDKSL